VIPFLHLGPVTISTYGLMVAVGLYAGFFVLHADLQRRHLPGDAATIIFVTGFAGIVGSKLYHVLEDPVDLWHDPLHRIFSNTGFAWFGGFLAGLLALILLGRHYGLSWLTTLDVSSPAAAVGYAFGRIGCLLSGDGDYGIPTSLPWGMSFPHGLVPTTQRVHPTPIYEFIAWMLIAWYLWRQGYLKASSRASRESSSGKLRDLAFRAPGWVLGEYLLLTGLARFLVEFIRINPRVFLGLTNAQWASLASMAAGALLLARLSRRQTSSSR
jgi:phosphatidylglycerol:prolipoprotein diacylglycerol transferase